MTTADHADPVSDAELDEWEQSSNGFAYTDVFASHLDRRILRLIRALRAERATVARLRSARGVLDEQ